MIDGLPDLLEWVMQKDPPFNLNFYRENELSLQNMDLRYGSEKMISGLLKALKVIEANLPCHTALGSIIDRSNLNVSHVHACEVGENYLVFDQNGQIAKCQMLIGEPIASIRDVDPLTIVHQDRKELQNLSVDEKIGCRNCEWKYCCADGCPLAAYHAARGQPSYRPVA